jgi:TIR domain-containing protein
VDRVPTDFFVSYTGVDQTWAEWIAHVLEDAGNAVAIQAWDFRPGSNFVIEMQKALQSADRLIAVLSPDYLAARYPQPEWAAVFAADPEGVNRRLVPVMVRKCQPDGLLGQVVQIRIHELDEPAAKLALLEGVRPGRAKPTAAPAYPGAARPGVGVAATAAAGARLAWRRAPAPAEVVWRAVLEDQIPHQIGYTAVEVHLVPVGDDGRLQVRDLNELALSLPGYGRQTKIFNVTEAINARATAAKAVAVSTARDGAAGIAVTRSGQRSAWTALPRDSLGAILDEAHLVDQITTLIDALTALSVPEAELVVPAVGVEPARMVSIGRVADLPRTSAQYGLTTTEYLRPAADDAVTLVDLRTHGREVAVELAARILVERSAPTRVR